MTLAFTLFLSLSGCNATPEHSPSPKATSPSAQPQAPATPEDPGSEASATHGCPMHPEVTGGTGDDCTICGMELVPISELEG